MPKPKRQEEQPEDEAAAVVVPPPPAVCVALAMGATCPACGYVRHAGNVEPHPVA